MELQEAMKMWSLVEGVNEHVDLKLLHKVSDTYHLSFSPQRTADDEYVVWEDSKSFYVAIGGSSHDILEWLSNFDAYKIIDGCHHGFYLSAKKILRQIKLPKHKTVYWIGYSRGGALAQVCSYLAGGGCITFGSPNPFVFSKRKELNFYHIAFRGKHDFVTRLPHWYYPPLWKRYATEVIKLKGVKGFDHTHYRSMILKHYM